MIEAVPIATRRRTETDFNKAIDYFQQAIEHDPAYALAHAALAECYVVLPSWSVLPPREVYPVPERDPNQGRGESNLIDTPSSRPGNADIAVVADAKADLI